MATAAPRGVLGRMMLRKSVAQVQEETRTSELKRSLGPWNLVFLGIGCIIGAGIFVRTGNAAALHAGPAVLISYLIAGVVCAFAGLCYAELASTLPVSGSAYTYSYTTIGEFAAWVMGALLLLEYGLAASVVAVGWSGYMVSLLGDMGLHIPVDLTGPSGHAIMVDGVATGGMQAKLNAATDALRNGIGQVIIAPGALERAAEKILNGEQIGTRLVAEGVVYA